MIQTVVICDRCKTEIVKPRRATVQVELYGEPVDDRRRLADLCMPCANTLLAFLHVP